jgi:hypothetical protein
LSDFAPEDDIWLNRESGGDKELMKKGKAFILQGRKESS